MCIAKAGIIPRKIDNPVNIPSPIIIEIQARKLIQVMLGSSGAKKRSIKFVT